MGDEAGGEAEEGFVDVVASFPVDAETSEAVQPGDRALDNPAVNAEAGAMRDSAAGDHRFDARGPDRTAVLVVVVTAVAELGRDPIPCAQKAPSAWTDRIPRQGSSSQLRRYVRISSPLPASSRPKQRGYAAGEGVFDVVPDPVS